MAARTCVRLTTARPCPPCRLLACSPRPACCSYDQRAQIVSLRGIFLRRMSKVQLPCRRAALRCAPAAVLPLVAAKLDGPAASPRFVHDRCAPSRVVRRLLQARPLVVGPCALPALRADAAHTRRPTAGDGGASLHPGQASDGQHPRPHDGAAVGDQRNAEGGRRRSGERRRQRARAALLVAECCCCLAVASSAASPVLLLAGCCPPLPLLLASTSLLPLTPVCLHLFLSRPRR